MLSAELRQQFTNPNLFVYKSLEEANEYINNKVLLDVPSNQVNVALGIYQNALVHQIVNLLDSAEEHF